MRKILMVIVLLGCSIAHAEDKPPVQQYGPPCYGCMT